MTFRLAVFDIAGTTISDPGFVIQAFTGALSAAGHTVAADSVRPLMGYPKPEAIARMLGEHASPALVERIHADFVQRMLVCYRNWPGIEPLPGAEALFARLRARGVKVALGTGFSRDIAEAIIERLDWGERIDGSVASDEVPAGRPTPHMIRSLMARFGVGDARHVLKVGDTEADINEGHNAGVGLNVAVTTGAFTRAELEPYRPDHIIDGLYALPALIGFDDLPGPTA